MLLANSKNFLTEFTCSTYKKACPHSDVTTTTEKDNRHIN